MWSRVNVARDDADTTLFLHLLYAGEMLTKLTAAGMVAAISDDREHQRYNIVHGLIRCDGLGDWVKAIDEALLGPSAQQLVDGAAEDRRSLTERFASGAWQYECVRELHEVVRAITPGFDELSAKVSLRQWFASFAVLRNKTRGHGALTPASCSKLCPLLEASVAKLANRLPLLNKPWVYLHRNLSGKFRVVPLNQSAPVFDKLRTTDGAKAAQKWNLDDGIYIDFHEPMRVELVNTDVDVADFYFPNGGFRGKQYELLSLISDNRKPGDASSYVAPAGERPASETEGKGALDIVGKSWTNIPLTSAEYVARPALERDLYAVLINDRHPIVTLVGRGGIGKTSLALGVLKKTALEGKFEAIFWFSARDIDLLLEGPKVVAPRVLSQSDIAKEFIRLLEPNEATEKGFKPVDYFASSLTKSPLGGPVLFVFDNFETVTNPSDLFQWLDMHVRLPNKILITSRNRDFKADFPIEVSGMAELEAEQLIDSTATRLDIADLMTQDYKTQLFEESDGHPYIMKVLLGEVAKAKKLVKVERIVAAKEDILEALFERTYAGFTPVAKRVFLTLCSWRSLVPEVGLVAVLLRPANEKMDISAALDELVSSSFVERKKADDGSVFLDVPLAAAIFGRKKLPLTPMLAAIEADVEFLQQIGATSASGVRFGISSRLERLFKNIANRLAAQRIELSAVVPSLEFICRQYSTGWLMLAKLHEEFGGNEALVGAAECYRRFLETQQLVQDQQIAWDELARIYETTGERTGAAQAKIRRCGLPDTPFSFVSNTANWLNNLLRESHLAIDSEEKRVLVKDLAEIMEKRSSEADATDLSRLAWLCLHLRDVKTAMEMVERGLTLDAENEHCVRLKTRLERERFETKKSYG
jgi:hypothetical protein